MSNHSIDVKCDSCGVVYDLRGGTMHFTATGTKAAPGEKLLPAANVRYYEIPCKNCGKYMLLDH